MRLDANVARWAVTVIELSRTKRHLDRAALMVFWEHLDKYVSIHRIIYIYKIYNCIIIQLLYLNYYRHMIKNKPHLRF